MNQWVSQNVNDTTKQNGVDSLIRGVTIEMIRQCIGNIVCMISFYHICSMAPYIKTTGGIHTTWDYKKTTVMQNDIKTCLHNLH